MRTTTGRLVADMLRSTMTRSFSFTNAASDNLITVRIVSINDVYELTKLPR